MNIEAAMEWIINNMENPNVDAPLTFNELQQIMQHYQHYSQQNQNKPIEPHILNAISLNVCTFCVTGKKFAHQKWYFCKTCGLVDDKGCCESCAKLCHNGHELNGKCF